MTNIKVTVKGKKKLLVIQKSKVASISTGTFSKAPL